MFPMKYTLLILVFVAFSVFFFFQSGKACLGRIMYHYITAKHFSPDYLLDYLDLSSEFTTLEIANRIEAATHFWSQNYQNKHLIRARNGKSSWGGKVKGFVGEIPKRKLLAKRAEVLMHNLRLRFPGLPQTALDVNKIQYNKVLPAHYYPCIVAFLLLFADDTFPYLQLTHG